jgi:hypothetical protein
MVKRMERISGLKRIFGTQMLEFQAKKSKKICFNPEIRSICFTIVPPFFKAKTVRVIRI